MLPTSLLFLAAIALAAFAVLVLAWAMFFALFTRRWVYGTVVVACGCLGGIGAVLLLLALSATFGSFAHTPSFENWLLAFGAGFGLAGGVRCRWLILAVVQLQQSMVWATPCLTRLSGLPGDWDANRRLLSPPGEQIQTLARMWNVAWVPVHLRTAHATDGFAAGQSTLMQRHIPSRSGAICRYADGLARTKIDAYGCDERVQSQQS